MDRRFLLVHLPTLLRLSLECPFPDLSPSLSSLVDLSTVRPSSPFPSLFLSLL